MTCAACSCMACSGAMDRKQRFQLTGCMLRLLVRGIRLHSDSAATRLVAGLPTTDSGSPWVNERVAREIADAECRASCKPLQLVIHKRLADMYTKDAVVVPPGRTHCGPRS